MDTRTVLVWGLRAGFSIALAGVWGCQPVPPTGVLGNGGFQYLCGSQEGDPSCTGSSGTADLPGAVAVGAKFQLAYTPRSSSGTTVEGANGYEVVPASSELALATGNTVVAQRAGYVALLARNTGTATVDDFVFLKLAAIAEVKTASPDVSLAAGQSSTLEVEAFDKLGAQLSGQLACSWTTSDPAIVEVASHTGLGQLTAGCAGGTATVTATCGAAAVVVTVTVAAGGCAGDAGVGTDASSDAGDAGAPNDGGSNG
jgi:hypothetical protein